MARASRGRMHLFRVQLKRAYWSVWKLFRPALRFCELTEARLDVMWVVWKSVNRQASQIEIAKSVGVAPSVVSRMVGSLERLGFVTADVDPDDRRRRRVKLTRRGSHLLKRARIVLIDSRVAQCAYQGNFEILASDPPTPYGFEALDAFARQLQKIAWWANDRSTIEYPLHFPRGYKWHERD